MIETVYWGSIAESAIHFSWHQNVFQHSITTRLLTYNVPYIFSLTLIGLPQYSAGKHAVSGCIARNSRV